MGRAATQHECVKAAIAQQQKNAIPYEGRAFVASLQQSAKETTHASEIKVVQNSAFAFHAEQQKSTSAELELQRSWYQREILFVREDKIMNPP